MVALARAEPIKASSFIQISHMGERGSNTWVMFSFPRPLTGSYLRNAGMGHDPLPICYAGVTGGSFTYYTIMLACKTHYKLRQNATNLSI